MKEQISVKLCTEVLETGVHMLVRLPPHCIDEERCKAINERSASGADFTNLPITNIVRPRKSRRIYFSEPRHQICAPHLLVATSPYAEPWLRRRRTMRFRYFIDGVEVHMEDLLA